MTARPDVDLALAGLKDFQRRSVDYVFSRFYGDDDPVKRFLVADEVGLGKTLVARGVIARAIDHLWESTERIDIIYICSNAAIARQNIRKLAVGADVEHALATRITMLPLERSNMADNKVNFVSFTPSTSFDLKSSLGKHEERVLLYDLLKEPWKLLGTAPKNVLQGKVTPDRFRRAVEAFGSARVDPAVRAQFVQRLRVAEGEAAAEGRESLRHRFAALCKEYPQGRSSPSAAIRSDRARLVGELRNLLAGTCLRSLEPDLIILDEFQRFKHLLDDEDENSQLARDLFNYADDNSFARVLLLSATPYKMYTVAGDTGNDDHFEDFLATLKFLQDDTARTGRTAQMLSSMRSSLISAGNGDGNGLRAQTRSLETELRRVMVRTERLAVSPDRDGMLTVSPTRAAELTAGDIQDYLSLAKIADVTEHYEPVEYWKSAPYLLSFMERYKFRTRFEELCEAAGCVKELAEAFNSGNVALDWNAIREYGALDPANARMRWLLSRVIESGAWRLLWIPPSSPSCQLGGAFAQPGVKELTKTLIFSAWQVVPRAISAIVSYEVERQIALSSNDSPSYDREDSSAPLRLDRDAVTPALTLLYPSFGLAKMASAVIAEVGRGATSEAILKVLEERIALQLGDLLERNAGVVDEAWYWAAPALIDSLVDHERTSAWLNSPDLPAMWAGVDSDAEGGVQRLFAVNVIPKLQAVVADGGKPLGTPPSNLVAVLARVALGSPAVAALRALNATITGCPDETDEQSRAVAGRIGLAFRNLFNLPEALGIIRGRSIVPYWQLVLDYCVDGCLADVLEEYSHMLLTWRGVDREGKGKQLAEIQETLAESVGLRTGQIGVDDMTINPRKAGVTTTKRRFRTRFAARLADDAVEDEQRGKRLSGLGKAFNSPFWPFVLASTSIGQEGLDFHLYCHAVAHWNLPSNPVDLEQREGRVHRFKGHAVRKNVSLRHGDVNIPASSDRWEAMFDAAVASRDPDVGDLVPYWVYCVDGGAKIERHLPTLPLSREAARYHYLRESLAIYRMVFGQPRQEDLLEYLRKHVPEDRLEEIREQVRIDLSPPVGTA